MEIGVEHESAATTAPPRTTVEMLNLSLSGPATIAPSGTVPPNAITQRAITRPRTESSSRFWSTVASDVTVTK